MQRLTNKKVIITGAAGEIANDLTRKCVEEGACVHLVDINRDALESLVESLGDKKVSYTIADVSSEQQTISYVTEALDNMEGIDIFFNNAGIEGRPGISLTRVAEEEWDRVMNINVKGVWLGLKHVAPEMIKRGGGSIIITSSVAGLGGSPGLGPYVTSKHALTGLMKTAAVELASHNIRVNTVNPSPVDTRMMRSIENGSGNQEKMNRILKSSIPMGRYADTGDVADMMFFLATDEAKFLTGGVYLVDGGMKAL